MSNNSTLKIHPNVDAVIKPIVYEMTRIDIAQKSNPIIGSQNEPDYIKETKKKCVHIIFENGEFRLATKRNDDGKLVCTACGRTINTKFDQSAVDTITAAIEVVNQVLFFGLLNGLRAEPLETLISIKTQLPAAAQLLKELNLYVKNENQNNDDSSNIGLEYATTSATLRPITQLG